MRPTGSRDGQLLLNLGKDRQVPVLNWGLRELSFTGLLQALQACNSRHPHVEALHPVVETGGLLPWRLSRKGRWGGKQHSPLHLCWAQSGGCPPSVGAVSPSCLGVGEAAHAEALSLHQSPHAAPTTQPTPQTPAAGKDGCQAELRCSGVSPQGRSEPPEHEHWERRDRHKGGS